MLNPKSSGTCYMFLQSFVNAWGEQKAFQFFDELTPNMLQYTSSGSGPVNALLLLKIPGIGETILSVITAEMGDISRFDDVKEIQKLSGLSLVACSSGKHKGETGISIEGVRN